MGGGAHADGRSAVDEKDYLENYWVQEEGSLYRIGPKTVDL
jgi:hypothetical protein